MVDTLQLLGPRPGPPRNANAPDPTPAELAARDRRDRIAVGYLRLVGTIARANLRPGVDYSDLFDVGQTALLVAAGAGADEGRRKQELTGYLGNAIRWAIVGERIRIDRRHRRDDAYAGPAAERREERAAARDRLAPLLDVLDPRERRAVTLAYGLDGDAPLTQAEVARELGLCRYYVNKILGRALRRMEDAGASP